MERLKGKKQIEHLFMTGKSVGAFPLRMVYLKNNTNNTVGVSVSKKHFKTAVDRNRIKRLLRVAVKDQLAETLNVLDSSFCMMILYLGKEVPKSSELKINFEALIKRFEKKLSNEMES